MFRNFVDKSRILLLCSALIVICLLAFTVPSAWAQTDQGAITGVVQDDQGAVIPGAKVTLTATDTAFSLERTANSDGAFVFSPVKIGNYKLTATAPSFQTTVRENLHLDIQQRLNITFALKPGAVTEQVTVSTEAPLLETQTSSVGQVISSETINNTPLNGRNWVYIAQLTAGVAPPFGNTRGSGTGDFVANGQSAEQNDFLLDGVDNNTNLIDFLNGSSFVMRPPPDALAEFNLQTSNFSSEFGHSAGAVMSASIKSGTNQIHGDVWEYVRNTSLDSTPWNATTKGPYHENQFGATLGFPIWKNHFFYFGDIEANRISYANVNIMTVPTALMRQGNFTELLQSSTYTQQNEPIQLYEPTSGGTQKLSCNGVNNVLCPAQVDSVAQNILNMYPLPNYGLPGQTFNNNNENLVNTDNTIQWDQRLDWNVSQKDQVYARYSYAHEIKGNGLPLGPILDGGGFGGQTDTNLSENFMLSETHAFAPTLTNEFRFGYNWIHSQYFQPNANSSTIAASLGLGGVPFPGPGLGGVPRGVPNEINPWGSVGTQDEAQNVYQILDNVNKSVGNHSLKAGVSFQALRVFDRYAPNPLGQYFWNNVYTGIPGNQYTGWGVADYLANQMNTAGIATSPPFDDSQWYDAAFFQDDWKIAHNFTLNLGLRYDHYEPYKERSGNQANFIDYGNLGISTGTAVYELPSRSRNQVLGAPFLATLAKDNIALQYNDNERLATGQNLNFAPRIGFSYQPLPKVVVRGGFGLFYGGLQSEGNTNLGSNFPWDNSANIPAPNCVIGNCPSLATEGITLETGLVSKTGNSLLNFVQDPSVNGIDPNVKTPYTVSYNLSVERAITNNMAATLSYVGNGSRHLPIQLSPNMTQGLYAPGTSTQQYQPFPDFGGVDIIHYGGDSSYNSLQAKLEKRASHGLSFLATYTWAHSLTNDSDPGGLESSVGDRDLALIPYSQEWTNSTYDVRHRLTVNGNYQLPFGKGRAFLNQSRWEDEIIGGWSSSLTFAAQTGTPFSVSPDITTASGAGGARAVKIRNPYTPGGTPDLVNNPGVTCATKTKTKTNWYNPCAFANPLPGNSIAPVGTPVGTGGYQFYSPVTGESAALALLGGLQNTVYGPGYYGVNMSLFKDFATFRKQYLSFRVDAFNVLNHPTLGNPSNNSNSSSGGQITGPKFFQQNTPDSRFLQLSAKYVF
ncbi:TonB-dependent receptor [Granulicella sp. S156]|jgi:Carboxypeptidase regulatory-like domain|uniref:TonB-dependent receptor n=1 Tax=Granulicella sp. S156 TaxID=1747224 RepID=UPI00131D3C64|nr:TonB-dependent receptor [Granulicella sp. S156]